MIEIFAEEKLKHVFDEMLPILLEHYREIAHYQDIEFEPDKEQYIKLEEIGIVKLFTVREECELIGYAVFFIKHNLHYKSSLQAVQDVIYIRKDRRGCGRKFIKWCDKKLREFGVQVVYHHVKQEHNFGKMLEIMDYKLIDLIYGKRLDK